MMFPFHDENLRRVECTRKWSRLRGDRHFRGEDFCFCRVWGGIVDAIIVEAPSSTKNRNKERDPEMHQTKKGNQWHFWM